MDDVCVCDGNIGLVMISPPMVLLFRMRICCWWMVLLLGTVCTPRTCCGWVILACSKIWWSDVGAGWMVNWLSGTFRRIPFLSMSM